MEYPAKRYVIGSTGKIREVELIRQYSTYTGYHRSVTGKIWHESDLFETPKAAITAGLEQVHESRERLNKQLVRLDTKFRNLLLAQVPE